MKNANKAAAESQAHVVMPALRQRESGRTIHTREMLLGEREESGFRGRSS